MKQYTLEQFADRTALLPCMVAENVLEYRGIHVDQFTEFIDSCAERTLYHYNTHSGFRKSMDGKSGREYLYAFTSHWLDAYIKNPESYLEKVNNFLSNRES